MFCESITFQRNITCPSFSSVEIQRYFSRRKLRILQICEPEGPQTTQRGQCMLSYEDYGNIALLGHQVVPTESTPHYATIDATFRCSFDFERVEQQIVGADAPAKNVSDKPWRGRLTGRLSAASYDDMPTIRLVFSDTKQARYHGYHVTCGNMSAKTEPKSTEDCTPSMPEESPRYIRTSVLPSFLYTFFLIWIDDRDPIDQVNRSRYFQLHGGSHWRRWGSESYGWRLKKRHDHATWIRGYAKPKLV